MKENIHLPKVIIKTTKEKGGTQRINSREEETIITKIPPQPAEKTISLKAVPKNLEEIRGKTRRIVAVAIGGLAILTGATLLTTTSNKSSEESKPVETKPIAPPQATPPMPKTTHVSTAPSPTNTIEVPIEPAPSSTPKPTPAKQYPWKPASDDPYIDLDYPEPKPKKKSSEIIREVPF